ncbi:MAG: Fur family transcriptional regulator, partial [Opitutales bacterium]
MVKSTASEIELACARLKKARMRITKPRVAILEALARQTTPMAIEKLHALLDGRQCDLVTVYRCLAAFEELGLVRRSFQHSGTCLYELSLGDRPAHYHVVCSQCGRIDPIDYFPVEGAERVLRERGYT